MVLGVTTAAAVPSVFDTLGWTPDSASVQEFSVDGAPPVRCDYRVIVKPSVQGKESGAFDAIQHFTRTHDWSLDDAPVLLSRADARPGDTDLGLISDFFSRGVQAELSVAFPDWREDVSSIESAGTCDGIGDDGMVQ
ncbi:hypothetical protein VD659_13495 [Herbiconiux sp. 11R-BC]